MARAVGNIWALVTPAVLLAALCVWALSAPGEPAREAPAVAKAQPSRNSVRSGGRSAETALAAAAARCLPGPARDYQALATAFRRAGCAALDAGEVRMATGAFEGPNGPVPLLVMSSTRSPPSGRAILLLVGGPGGSAPDALAAAAGAVPSDDIAAFYRGLAERGDLIVVPAYPGTFERTLHGQANLAAALAELETLVRALRDRGQRVVLHGQSLGGKVAMLLSPRIGDEVPLVLLNPVLWSAADWTAHIRDVAALPMEHAWVDRWIWREGRPPGAAARPEQLRISEAFTGFFGAHDRSRASDHLRGSNAPVAIVYSRFDARTGPAEILRLAGRPRLMLIDTGIGGHGFETKAEQRRGAAALRRAFASVGEED